MGKFFLCKVGDVIRRVCLSRVLGDVYKQQAVGPAAALEPVPAADVAAAAAATNIVVEVAVAVVVAVEAAAGSTGEVGRLGPRLMRP